MKVLASNSPYGSWIFVGTKENDCTNFGSDNWVKYSKKKLKCIEPYEPGFRLAREWPICFLTDIPIEELLTHEAYDIREWAVKQVEKV